MILRFRSACRASAIALVVVSGANGCSAISGPSSTDQVAASARNGQIEVRNNSQEAAFIFVLGREAAAYTDWIACADPTACTPIAAGSRRSVAYPSSQVRANEREALVFWWHAVRGMDGDFRPDSIRSVIVPL